MNKLLLVGRLTADPELKENKKDSCSCRFSIAVRRSFKNSEGEYEADFINCVAFNGQAELIHDFCSKGQLVSVEGRIQTGSYEDSEGITRKSFDCIVEKLTFLESKKDETKDDKKSKYSRK